MKQIEFRFLPLLLALIVIGSSVLLAYSYLQSSVSGRQETAQQFESNELTEEAIAEYKQVIEFLGSSSLLRGQFEEDYSDAMIGQLRLLYQLEQYDDAIELAEISINEEITDSAAAYFWSGNAYFQKGIHEEMMEDAFAWFHRAQDEYRKGLEKDAGQRWNLRYNYELVRTALEQAEQEEEDEPVKILRPRDQIEQADAKVAG
ncbi:MAG: hypothetical protein O6826_07630 [Acidobacteria bacterium]|nr:hypothetical protein [Acidobacteriota bacterium]MCZ6768206.1 hypothetical protein [Acidobacteriota bacterium]MCZ6876820.1 hypothetical protein [Acidobacteriota bacterium]